MALTIYDLEVRLDQLYVADLIKNGMHTEWVMWPSTLSAEFTASDLRAIADKLDELNGPAGQ